MVFSFRNQSMNWLTSFCEHFLRVEHPNNLTHLTPPSRCYIHTLPAAWLLCFRRRLIKQGLRFQGRVLHLRELPRHRPGGVAPFLSHPRAWGDVEGSVLRGGGEKEPNTDLSILPVRSIY